MPSVKTSSASASSTGRRQLLGLLCGVLEDRARGRFGDSLDGRSLDDGFGDGLGGRFVGELAELGRRLTGLGHG